MPSESSPPPRTEPESRAAAARQDALIASSGTESWDDLHAFVASQAPSRGRRDPVRGQRETGYHCSQQVEDWEDGYSFDHCEVVRPGPRGALFVKGAGDYHEIDPNDVKQGAIGDCYVLSSLSSLARTEEGRARIRGAITEVRRGGDTIYRVTLRRPLSPEELSRPHDPNRPWKELVVEVRDAFPSSRAHVGDVEGGRAEKWVMVMEKAITMVLGGGDMTGHGGYAADVLPYLTGEPARIADPAELWQSVASGGAVVVATPEEMREGTPADKADPKKLPPHTLEKIGLVPGHAYSVDRVFVGTDGRRYVQLRNPWGYEHGKPIAIDQLAALKITVTTSPPPKP